MIKSVSSLKATCSEASCGERANFRVLRTNDELPAHYVQWGTRSVYYCSTHLPDEARAFFGSALYPGEENFIEVPK